MLSKGLTDKFFMKIIPIPYFERSIKAGSMTVWMRESGSFPSMLIEVLDDFRLRLLDDLPPYWQRYFLHQSTIDYGLTLIY